MKTTPLFVAVALLALAVSCDDGGGFGGPAGFGEECDVAADDPCDEGLQCLVSSEEAPDDAGDLVCSTAESFCSKPCGFDDDCDEGQICVDNCDDGDDEGGADVAGLCFEGSRG
jgi:hypothetical protein